MRVRMSVRVGVSVRVCKRVRVRVRMDVCVGVRVRLHVRARVHARMRACVGVRMRVCVSVCMRACVGAQDGQLEEALQGEGHDSWLARKMYVHEARMSTLMLNVSYSPSVLALDFSSLRSLQVPCY